MAEEILANTVNDVSSRGATNETLAKFRGKPRQLVINIDDNYRPVIMDGVTLGGKFKVASVDEVNNVNDNLNTVAEEVTDLTGKINTVKNNVTSLGEEVSNVKNTANNALTKSKADGYYLGKTANAVSATKLAAARTVTVNLASNTAASFDGTKNITPGVSGILPVANGGTGSSDGAVLLTGDQTVAGTKTFSDPIVASAGVTGNASSATKLATARTVCTNLASTSAASFNGTANITPGVSGILPIANGGTGSNAGAVLLTGTQTVAGAKTFSDAMTVNGALTLKGTSTTPTPASTDNSTKIANTAWVNIFLNSKVSSTSVASTRTAQSGATSYSTSTSAKSYSVTAHASASLNSLGVLVALSASQTSVTNNCNCDCSCCQAG